MIFSIISATPECCTLHSKTKIKRSKNNTPGPPPSVILAMHKSKKLLLYTKHLHYKYTANPPFLPSFLPSHASSELFSSAAAAAAASKMFANLIMCTKTGREGKGESETTKKMVMMNRRKKLLQSARKIRWSKAKFFPLFSLSSLFLFAPPFLFRSPPGIPTARTPGSSRTNARRLSSTRVVPPNLFQKPT
jgi:hypothetical protein